MAVNGEESCRTAEEGAVHSHSHSIINESPRQDRVTQIQAQLQFNSQDAKQAIPLTVLTLSMQQVWHIYLGPPPQHTLFCCAYYYFPQCAQDDVTLREAKQLF